jgi:hypothetical protein
MKYLKIIIRNLLQNNIDKIELLPSIISNVNSFPSEKKFPKVSKIHIPFRIMSLLPIEYIRRTRYSFFSPYRNYTLFVILRKECRTIIT